MARINFAALPAVNAGHFAQANIQAAQAAAYQAQLAAPSSTGMGIFPLLILALALYFIFRR